MQVNYDRRTLLKDTLLLLGAAMTMATLPVASAPLTELKETDPEGQAIDYHSNIRKIDKSRYPTYAAGQTCNNCALVGFSSAMLKPCKLTPGKLVNGRGWCTKWVQKT